MKAKVIKTGEIVDVYHESQHGQITNIYKESVLVNGRMWTEDELDFSIKTNEAPEKLYLFPNGQILYRRYKGDNVEYTRTDDFIKKACEYLQINLWRVVNEEPDFRQRFVTDFKNYMKGE